MAPRIDKELEEFRSVMEPPSQFEEGFTWQSLAGAVFIGLVMVPGAMYMSLLAGMGVGPAAQWVTVILFIEVARRARKTLKRAELFVLFYMAGAVMATPFAGLLWNQFFVQSDAARAAGLAGELPSWFAPSDPEVLAKRTFFHVAWLPVIGLIIFQMFIGRLSQMVLGYGLFRLTVDVERLPFPMAPVGAQGIVALAEDSASQGRRDERSWRWRLFTLGSGLGMIFGFLYLGLPTITGALLPRPIQILPIPFVDWTPMTADYLPAVATGLSLDLGQLIVGMVLPFWAMLGSFVSLITFLIVNPILHAQGMLPAWTAGDNTVQTLFKNTIDFYFSFSIGIALAIALAGIVQAVSGIRKRKAEMAAQKLEQAEVRLAIPKDRGDIPTWFVVFVYFLMTLSYIVLSGFLIQWHPGVMIVLIFLGFFYMPFINYVRARLEGMAGQVVDIPMIRETAFILSGYRGAAVWFLPVPLANFTSTAVFYRQSELTGTRFRSIWKSQVFLFPIVLISSIFFANFIWSLAPIPSATFPFTDRMWEFQAQNRCILFTATMGGYSQFEEALKWPILITGFGFGSVLFFALNWMGLPIMFVYGVVRGMNQTMPHVVIPQFIGALIGRFYFRKRLKEKWRQYIPVFAAGFGCGAGLITMLGVGFTFLSKAVSQLPF